MRLITRMKILRWKLFFAEKAGSAQIIIRDYGIGIPVEDLTHVTERFYRVNKARSRADGGSGLGLSIVEQLLKQLQGTLEIESVVEKAHP